MTDSPRNDPICFDWQTMRWKNLTVSQIETWQKLYPDVDVIKEVAVEAVKWLDKKRGTKITRKKRWNTFLTNWLKKEQLKAVGL